jgi:flagellar hook-length control protein FliK
MASILFPMNETPANMNGVQSRPKEGDYGPGTGKDQPVSEGRTFLSTMKRVLEGEAGQKDRLKKFRSGKTSDDDSTPLGDEVNPLTARFDQALESGAEKPPENVIALLECIFAAIQAPSDQAMLVEKTDGAGEAGPAHSLLKKDGIGAEILTLFEALISGDKIDGDQNVTGNNLKDLTDFFRMDGGNPLNGFNNTSNDTSNGASNPKGDFISDPSEILEKIKALLDKPSPMAATSPMGEAADAASGVQANLPEKPGSVKSDDLNQNKAFLAKLEAGEFGQGDKKGMIPEGAQESMTVKNIHVWDQTQQAMPQESAKIESTGTQADHHPPNPDQGEPETDPGKQKPPISTEALKEATEYKKLVILHTKGHGEAQDVEMKNPPQADVERPGTIQITPNDHSLGKSEAGLSLERSNGSQHVSRNDIFAQIVDKADLSLKNGQSEIKIDLKPEFLGPLRMKVSTDNHQVTVKIITDVPIVKEAIDSNIQQLRTALQNQGLEIDDINISMGEDYSRQRGQQEGFQFEERTDSDEKIKEETIDVVDAQSTGNGIIDKDGNQRINYFA